MSGGAEFVQNLRRNELMRAETRSTVDDAMTYCNWRGGKMLAELRRRPWRGRRSATRGSP